MISKDEGMDFASYEHLWNGAETGWVVHRHLESRVEVTVVFGEQGASMQDVRALRSAVPQYGAQSAMGALLSIRGKKSLVLGDFESREARELKQQCESMGLRIHGRGYQLTSDSLINETTRMHLLIEDEAVQRIVVQEALRHGLPLRHSEF
jgi:hypothetical protein